MVRSSPTHFALVGAALAAAALSFAATPLQSANDAGGVWELSLDGSNRKCQIILMTQGVGATQALRFPAGCRRALPILNTTAGWGLNKGLIRFLGQDGQPLLSFELRSSDQAGLAARGPGGEAYLLEPKERAPGSQQLESAAPRLPPRLASPMPRLTPVEPDKAPPVAAVPGVYVVDRYLEREVCRISLEPATLDATGRNEAHLLEDCHDNGLHVFDPAAWHYEAGRLTLQARRGHQVSFIPEREGQWRRDPDVGSTLVLRKEGP